MKTTFEQYIANIVLPDQLLEPGIDLIHFCGKRTEGRIRRSITAFPACFSMHITQRTNIRNNDKCTNSGEAIPDQ